MPSVKINDDEGLSSDQKVELKLKIEKLDHNIRAYLAEPQYINPSLTMTQNLRVWIARYFKCVNQQFNMFASPSIKRNGERFYISIYIKPQFLYYTYYIGGLAVKYPSKLHEKIILDSVIKSSDINYQMKES